MWKGTGKKREEYFPVITDFIYVAQICVHCHGSFSLFLQVSFKCFWNCEELSIPVTAHSRAWKRWMTLHNLCALLRQKEKSWDAGSWSGCLPMNQHISAWNSLSSHLCSDIFLRIQINRSGSAWHLFPPFANFQQSGTLFSHVFFLWVYKMFWSPMG